MNLWLDVYNDAMEGEYRAEQVDARADYDAACARRQRLIDEAETLCGELDALADRAENATHYCRLIRVLMRADSRYARRFAADVEF